MTIYIYIYIYIYIWLELRNNEIVIMKSHSNSHICFWYQFMMIEHNRNI